MLGWMPFQRKCSKRHPIWRLRDLKMNLLLWPCMWMCLTWNYKLSWSKLWWKALMFKNFRMKLLARKRKKDALKSRNNLRSFHKRMDEVQSVKMKKIQEDNLSQSCHMSCVESIILYQSSYEKKVCIQSCAFVLVSYFLYIHHYSFYNKI